MYKPKTNLSVSKPPLKSSRTATNATAVSAEPDSIKPKPLSKPSSKPAVKAQSKIGSTRALTETKPRITNTSTSRVSTSSSSSSSSRTLSSGKDSISRASSSGVSRTSGASSRTSTAKTTRIFTTRSSSLGKPLTASKATTNSKPLQDIAGSITMFKVAKKHLFNSQESNEEQAKKLTRLRLDRLEISNLEEGLDLFGSSVSHFFLQHNKLTAVPDLSLDVFKETLTFLSLGYNQISVLTGFSRLGNLVLLNLEGNLLNEAAFDPSKALLPKNLEYIILQENPICQNPEYRLLVVAQCPGLVEIDEKQVTVLEKSVSRNSYKTANFSDLDMTNDNDQDRDQEDSTLTLAKENSDIGQEEDVYFSRLRSILERSKQRQMEKVGRAEMFEKMIAVNLHDRKDHWKQISSKLY